jgi:hypothetical protein
VVERTGVGHSPELHETLSQILRLIAEPLPPQVDRALLAGLATSIWRLGNRHKKLASNLASESLPEVRHLGRALQMAEEVLGKGGIEIRDYLGQPHDPGCPPRVVGGEARPGIAVDTVVQTVNPTVYYNGSLVQNGEIIVDTPLKKEE